MPVLRTEAPLLPCHAGAVGGAARVSAAVTAPQYSASGSLSDFSVTCHLLEKGRARTVVNICPLSLYYVPSIAR